MDHAQEQLQSIQSMLAAGHRSVQLERHSLLLIGGVGGFLAAFTDDVITAERFPDLTRHALALLLWLGVWLAGMAAIDHWLTRRARQRRDETLPFAQTQITRAWWMLLTMGTLFSVAMFFYGGGKMVYALWIVLLGLGVYLFGLFSRPLVEWIGLATILVGVTALAARLPYGTTHWLAASCFAIGMPLAGWMNVRCDNASSPKRLLALAAWIMLVIGPPLAWARPGPVEAPGNPVLNLGARGLDHGAKVLRLEPGTAVMLRIDMDSPLLAVPPQSGLATRLVRPLEIALKDGLPDGRYQVGGNGWHSIRDGALTLRIDRIAPRLEDGLPVVRAHAALGTAFPLEGAR